MEPLLPLLLLLAQDVALPRKPVPDAAKLSQAEKLVRDVLKDDYAKSGPAERKALSKKLLGQGLEAQEDPAVTYVLLKNSRGVAAEVGDIETGLAAIDALARAFEVDALKEKQSFLTEAGKAARPPATYKGIAEAWLGVSAEALKLESFEMATTSSEAAVAAAKAAKDLPLLAKAESARKGVESAKVRLERLKAAKEALLKDPEDASANLIVGYEECVTRGKWAVGLPPLAKGSDPALKDAATRELAVPKEAADQLSLADAWWAIAEKESGEAKDRFLRRAGYWYLRARGRLSSLARMKADKRLEALGSLKPEEESPDLVGHWSFEEGMGTSAADSAGPAGPMSLIKTASWGEGRIGKALDLNGNPAHATVADLPALNFGTDSFSVACFIRLRKTTSARLVNKWQQAGNVGWLFDANTGAFTGAPLANRPGTLRVRMGDGKTNIDHSVDAGLRVDTWTHVALVVDRKAGDIKLFAGGEPAGAPRGTGGLGAVSSSAPLAVGYLPGTPPGNFLHGSVDELRVYRRALSPADVKELAAAR